MAKTRTRRVRNDDGTPRAAENSKDTNPKDAVGVRKWRQYAVVPCTVMWEVGVALLEGARKYGRHNYRVSGVRASVYVDATKGHIDAWWEGRDIDPDSGLCEITKAIASLVVLRDAMMQGKFVDDRPPRSDVDAIQTDLQRVVDGIFERHPDAVPAYVEGDQYQRPTRKGARKAKPAPARKAKRRSAGLALEDMHGPGPATRRYPMRKTEKNPIHKRLATLRRKALRTT